MRVVIGIEQRFLRLPDGSVWSNGIGRYEYWSEKVLDTFEDVLVVARVKDVQIIPDNWSRVDGIGVAVHSVPYYVGPKQYLQQRLVMGANLKHVIRPNDAVIVRAPGQIAAALVRRRQFGPYGVEVLGDPWDAFSPGAIVHPFRAVFRRYFRAQLETLCINASSIAYVTRSALQLRYPGGPQTQQFQVTDGVDDVENMFSPVGHPAQNVVIFVGSMAQMYKAPDVLLRSIAICTFRFDLPLKLVMIGDGRHRKDLEQLASDLGIGSQVEFTGELPSGASVRKRLDNANLFVLPSRTEGLPRALIEAMARGLPCIGSNIGGIPELLDETELVKPGDDEALATKLSEIAADSSRMQAMSKRNTEIAREYLNKNLEINRRAFHETLKAQTVEWIDRRQGK